MRKVLVLSLIILAFATAGHAQTVYQKDRWGARLLFLQENTVRAQDRWGTPLYYFDGQTLRIKDRWGDAVYYFDFIPSQWLLASIILL